MTRIILVVLSVCFMAMSAFAQDKQLQSDEVLVTATRTEKVAKEVPMTLSVMTGEEITRQGASNIADILRDVPGVQVTSTGAAGVYRLNLRGESGSRSLVMIDGVKLSEQKSMDGAPLLIDTNSIERIEVIKGPASVLYGSEAIGGAINVITKKGGDKPIQGTVTTTYNSGTEGFDTSIALYGSYKGFYYRGEGTRSNHGNRIDTDGDEIDHTEYDNLNIRLLTGYESDKYSFGVEHTDYRSDNEVRTGYEDSESFAMEMDLPDWDRQKTAAYVELKELTGKLSKVRIDAYRQSTYKKFVNNMFMTQQMGPMVMSMESLSTTENDLMSTGANLQMDFDLHDTNLLIAGFEYMKDDLEVDDTKKGFGASAFDYYDSEAEQVSKAFFVHDEQMLGDNFILSGGLRYTITDTELTSTDNPSYEKGSSDTKSVVGSVSLVYTGVKNTALRALYSRGYRTPNLQQLYMGTTHGSTIPTYSNPDLDPESSDNYEIGVRFDNKALDVDAAIFHNKAKDYITTIATTINGADARFYRNVDKANTTGLELAAGYRIADFRPYINGTYMRRKYETDGFSTTKNGMPEKFGRLGVQYDKSFKKSFFSSDIYLRYASDAEDEASGGLVDRTDGYTTYNLNLNYGYNLKDGRRVIITAEALNITNKEYFVALSPLEEPGRHFILKATVDF